MNGRLPSTIVYTGGAIQCFLLGAGLTLLALFGVEMVWTIFVVSHCQLLALLVHCWVTVQQLRRQTFFLWMMFVAAIALLSTLFLLLGSLVPDWPFPVFSAQCIFALIDAVGALFRYRFMSKVDGTADDGLFSRLNTVSPSSVSQTHPLESLPSLPANGHLVSNDFCEIPSYGLILTANSLQRPTRESEGTSFTPLRGDNLTTTRPWTGYGGAAPEFRGF